METKKILKNGSLFLKFIMLIQIILCVGLVFIYFDSMVSPEKYNSLIIDESRRLVFNHGIEKVPETYEQWKATEKFIHYNLLNDYSKFYIIWTKVIKFLGYFFILYLLNLFLKNTKSYDLFFGSNIKILNKIILLIIALFIIDFALKGFTLEPISMVFNETDIPHFVTKERVTLDFIIYYPLAIIFFYILKEVFKRGRELKEENDLTI